MISIFRNHVDSFLLEKKKKPRDGHCHHIISFGNINKLLMSKGVHMNAKITWQNDFTSNF